MALYAELRPQDVSFSLAVQPWGALEWHGSHLPLGLDGLVADWFAQKLADEHDGVCLPPQYNPVTTLPHQLSLQVSTSTFRLLMDEILDGLFHAGFESIVIVSGHYAQGHMSEMYQASIRAISKWKRPVWSGTPLEPMQDGSLLDHAGLSEASQLMAIRPDLVLPGDLPAQALPKHNAVLGAAPSTSSVEYGQELLQQGLVAWREWMQTTDTEHLVAYYLEADRQLDEYREKFYKESWEQAIQDWWASK